MAKIDSLSLLLNHLLTFDLKKPSSEENFVAIYLYCHEWYGGEHEFFVTKHYFTEGETKEPTLLECAMCSCGVVSSHTLDLFYMDVGKTVSGKTGLIPHRCSSDATIEGTLCASCFFSIQNPPKVAKA